MMEFPTDENPVVVVEGDCLDVLRALPDGCVDAVVTDPPYGMDWDTDSTRFTGGKGGHNKRSTRVHGDSVPFNPSPWLHFPRVVLWGVNHYAERLPVGTTLVWIKKPDAKFGVMLSDCELAWVKGGHGVYAHRQVWDGCAREGEENGVHHHPTQKPVRLMRWCIHKAKVPEGGIILDPFAGSGTTGVAAIAEGRRAILIEKEPDYAAICRRRVAEAMGLGKGSLLAALQPSLFGESS